MANEPVNTVGVTKPWETKPFKWFSSYWVFFHSDENLYAKKYLLVYMHK